jgi:hypothetical protein
MSSVQAVKDNPYLTVFFGTTIMFMVLWLTRNVKRYDPVASSDKCVGQTTLCIDTRFQAPMQNYFRDYFATPYFNNYIVPGVSLALLGTSTIFNPTGTPTAVGGGINTLNYMRAWVSSMAIARTLHSISTIAFMDHEDCGYFKVFFNGGPGMSYSNLADPTQVFSWPGGTRYSALTSVQQQQTHYYYLEQVKNLWSNGMLNRTTNSLDIYMADWTNAGTFQSSQGFTGVQLQTFYIDLNGNISKSGATRLCL